MSSCTRREVEILDAELGGERLRQVELRHDLVLEQHLPEALTGLLLADKTGLDLLVGDQAHVDQDLAETLLARTQRHGRTGRGRLVGGLQPFEDGVDAPGTLRRAIAGNVVATTVPAVALGR